MAKTHSELEQFILQKYLPPIWAPKALKGSDAYLQLCTQWESWLASGKKLKPNGKAKKMEALQRLLMVCRAITKQMGEALSKIQTLESEKMEF